MIAVIGLGFVGLTTALGMAEKGYKVYAYDLDLEKTANLKKGVMSFYEPHLKDFSEKHLDKNFFICDTLEDAISNATMVFYCVGTPSGDDGEADLGFLKSAVTETLKHTGNKFKTLVIKSTIPPSTTEEVIKPMIEEAGFVVGRDIGLVNNPEFLREGLAWEDFVVSPDRIVIGENDKKSGDAVEEIYKPFGAPVFRVSLNTGEFIKYLSNTLLASMISFSNEMSIIADTIGDIDIPSSFKILHMDKRWSGSPAKMTSYVYPGCGFGGYCLPKDVLAVLGAAKKKGYTPSLLEEVVSVNRRVKEHTAEKIKKAAVDRDKSIGILGLAFKPETDDVRDTPAKDIIEILLRDGYNNIVAYDPLAMDIFKKVFNMPIEYAATLEDVVAKCDVLVVLTAWREFIDKNGLLGGKKVIDGRYCL